MHEYNADSFLQGCSCNQQLKDAAQQQGFTNNAVAVSKSCSASDIFLDWRGVGVLGLLSLL